MTTNAADDDISFELKKWQARLGLNHAMTAERLRLSSNTIKGWARGRPCSLSRAILRLMEWEEHGLMPDDLQPRRSKTKRDSA